MSQRVEDAYRSSADQEDAYDAELLQLGGVWIWRVHIASSRQSHRSLTISSMFQTLSEIPASIAGVTQNV